MLLGQKINALAMLGSQDDIDDILKPLQSKGIYLHKRNFVSSEDLIAAVKKDKNIEYVILSDSGMLGVRDGKYTVPVEIASLGNIHIAIFFNMEKYNEGYLQWAAKFGIHCIYYANDLNYTDENGYDFNKILKEIRENRRIYSDAVQPGESESEEIPSGKAPQVITVEKIVPLQIIEKEVIREVKVVESQPAKRSLFGRSQQAPQVPQVRRTSIVGVYGSSAGAGATSLCVFFAKHLASKHKVAIVERNLKGHLAEYLDNTVEIFSKPLNEIDIGGYDYIVIDFGTLYDLSATVPVYIKTPKDEILLKQADYGIEKRYCTHNIIVCPALPWRLPEIEFYLEDMANDNNKGWVFLFNGDHGNKVFNKFIKKYHDRRMIFTHENQKTYSELQEMIDNI